MLAIFLLAKQLKQASIILLISNAHDVSAEMRGWFMSFVASSLHYFDILLLVVAKVPSHWILMNLLTYHALVKS